MQAFKTDCDADLNTFFEMTPEGEKTGHDDENQIDAQHLLEYLFAPRTHLSAYEHLLGCLARYTSRAGQGTEQLEDAMTILRRAKRRVAESQQLWPFVKNMPTDGSLGSVPSNGGTLDVNRLPQPVTILLILNKGFCMLLIR